MTNAKRFRSSSFLFSHLFVIGYFVISHSFVLGYFVIRH